MLLLLAVAFTGQMANAQSLPHEQEPSITLRLGEQVEHNQDSMGIAFLNHAVGLISNDAKIYLYKVDGSRDVIAVMGNTDKDSGPTGIIVSPDGEYVQINSSKVVISRKTFASHSEADAALVSGEEYYLQGDRLTYHKP